MQDFNEKKGVGGMYYENEMGKIYFEVHGRENAPAIIFSQGINMNHETFKGQVEGLKDKFRIITWDLPYHGKSSPIDNNLSFSQVFANFIKELLQHLKIEKAVLGGLSLGSYVTQVAAYKYPEITQASIHIGGGPLHPPSGSFLKIFNPLLGLFIHLYPSPRVFKDFARHRTLENETRAYLERIAAANGKWVMAHLTKELLRDMARGLPAFSPEPRLLIHGVREIGFVQKQMKKWEKETRESRLVEIEKAHHIANQDNPEKVNQTIEDFLDEILEK